METLSIHFITWLGIVFCISQSAIFSGLNLALLGISRLRLEVDSQAGNPDAIKILGLRKDVNFLLTTILWGNVAINVLLTLLSHSVMAGFTAFIFSTVLITFVGEIAPQAYFSRNAMRMGSLLSPLLRFYQFILYPVAKPSALALDFWLGREGISFFKEKDLLTLIHKHIESEQSDVSELEGVGAMNFLTLDDFTVIEEGEAVDPSSIINLPMHAGKPLFPRIENSIHDPFLLKVNRSGKKWVIIVDDTQKPRLVLNASAYLRAALFSNTPVNPHAYCHSPILVTDVKELIGNVLSDLKVYAESDHDDVVDQDIILIWAEQKRVITGSDILGRLLRGITRRAVMRKPA